MSDCIIVVDRGSTNIKVVAFDTQGNEIITVSSACASPTSPKPGWWEQDMVTIWENTVEAIQRLFSTNIINPNDIIGVITCGQGNGLIAIDSAGNPVRAGILSLDARATEIYDEWKKSNIYGDVVSQVGMPFPSGSPLPLLAWVKQHEPLVFDKIETILFSKDWLRFKLSGSRCTDMTDASGSGLINLEDGKYNYHGFNQLGLGDIDKLLPELRQTHEIVGAISEEATRLTGIPLNTPVLCGAHDIGSFPFGIGKTATDELVSVIGTWGLNLLPTKETKGHVVVFNHIVPDYYLTGIGDGNSGGCLDVILNLFGGEENIRANELGISQYEHVENLIHETKPNDIIFVPHIFGSLTEPNASASFYGIKNWNNKSDILRAIYEGIVFGYLSNIKMMRSFREIKSIWIIGGGMKSSVFPQLFSDVFGLPVHIANTNEITARGCALSALVGLGIKNSYIEASLPVGIKETKTTQTEFGEYYRKKFELFEEIVEQNNKFNTKLSTLRK